MVDLARRELPVGVRTSLPVLMPVVLAGGIAVVLGVAGGLAGGPLVLGLVGLVGLVLGVFGMVRPPRLVLDEDGVALRTPIGERWRQPWAGCGEFRVWRGTCVVWDSAAEAARYPRRAASWRRRAEADAGLVAQFGGLPAADLASLLNRYRTAAGGQPST